jgi:receptor protein-tyrosine kinase
MSVDPSQDIMVDPADEVFEAVIAHYQLSPEYIDRIRTAARSLQMGLSDTAIHLGLLTTKELEEVIAAARVSERTVQDSGIVEAALRRNVAGRSVVLRHGGPVKPSKRLILAHDQDNPRSEQIRALRTALLLLNEPGRRANMVALLSPCAGEGRSQLAAELAISFSQLGRRTLLIDGDLRRSQQHVLFDAWNYLGLTQSLTLAQLPQLLSVEGLPHLSLLTAGISVPNPLELLSDGRFERMLSDWRHQYDFIVLDTPPVNEFSDALAISALAGRVLICSRAAVTPFAAMKDMLQRLASTQSTVLGAVINDF